MKLKLHLVLLCIIVIVFSSNIKTAKAQTPTINVTLGTQSTVPVDMFGYNGANFIRPSMPSYNSQWLIDSLSSLGASSIRYPAGTVGNYFDWQTGFFDQQLPDGFLPLQDFGNNAYKNLDLNTFKTMADRSGVMPILSLNLLTKDKYYETARLMYATGINVNVKYIEYGDEFYHEGRNYQTRFPTAESYVAEVNQWASYMKSRPGLSNIKIAAVGATDHYPDEPAGSRRNRWNQVVASNANSSVDALTLHWYISPFLGDLAVNEQNAPRIVESPFKAFDDLSPELADIRAAGKEAWFTEFNLLDRKHCLQQDFAHGLFAAGMTLSLLQDTVIKKMDCHALVGSGLYGSIFNDNGGLDLSSFYNDDVVCNAPVGALSNVHEFTAQGVCMQLVGQALQNAQYRRKMSFSNCPKLPLGYDALFGYWLGCKTTDEMIILNLDSVDRTININSADFNVTNGKYIQVYPGPGGVLDQIKGHAKLNPGNMECGTTGTVNATQTLTLRKYSVTRIYVKKNLVKVKATDITLCSGTNTTVLAEGGSGYTWNNAALVAIKPDNSVMQFNAPVVTAQTSYKLKVTTAQGYTDSVTLTVYPKPVLTITQNATQICKGGTVNFTATLTGGNSAASKSFIWMPSQYFTKADTAIAVAKIPDNVTIRCYASDGLCFAVNDSLPPITVIPNANAGSDVSICIDSLPYTLSALQVNAQSTYKWYDNNGVLISNNSTATVSPAFPTTYRLIVSTGSNSCKDTDYVTINPFNCCKSSNYPTSLTITPGKSLANNFIPDMMAFCASHPGHGYCTKDTLKDFHDEIVINGDFFVDTKFTFINCDKINFAEKARMKFVDGTPRLSFYNCTLQASACSNRMWNGFYFYNFNSLLLLDNCLVYDCENIVEGYVDPRLFISNTKFDRFYKGIYLAESEQKMEGWVYGSTFTQTSTLKYPHAGEKSLYAYKLDNYTFLNIGDTGYSQNLFSNLQYGIISLNSDLSLFNSRFENITRWNTNDTLNGTAVLLQNTFGYGDPNNPTHLYPEIKFYTSDANTAKPNKFKTCTNGIYAINARVDIRGNSFVGVNKAITLLGITSKLTNIRGNTITGSDVGIDVIQPKLGSVNIISNNITTTPQLSGIMATPCIRVLDVPGQTCALSIYSNLLHTGGTHGIWLINSQPSLNVSDNKVYMNNPNATFTSYGMRMENIDSLTFKCNLSKGNSTAAINNKTAFSFSFCTNAAISCNTADLASTGFEFLGNCNNATLKNNWMKYLNDGLVIGAVGQTGGVVGPQPVSSTGLPLRNLFMGQYIDNNSGPGFLKGHFGHAATWAINSNCTGARGTTTQFFGQYNDSLTIPYPNLATGTGSGAFTPYIQKKLGKECLVNCVVANPLKPIPALLSENFDADDYSIQTDISKDYTYTVKNVLPNLENDATAWSVKSDLFNTLKNNVAALDNNIELQDFYATTQNSNIAAFGELNAAINNLVYSENDRTLESKLSAVKAMNAAIIATNPVEKSAKAFNSIYFKSIEGYDKLNNSDIAELKKLAFQCPYIAGTSVFQARALYGYYNHSANYDDAVLCTGKYLLNNQEQNKLDLQSISVEIFPNPGSGIYNLRYDLTNFANAQITFYDLVGKEVKSANLNVNTDRAVIEMNNLNEGIYYYSIIADGKQVNHGKVTLIK